MSESDLDHHLGVLRLPTLGCIPRAAHRVLEIAARLLLAIFLRWIHGRVSLLAFAWITPPHIYETRAHLREPRKQRVLRLQLRGRRKQVLPLVLLDLLCHQSTCVLRLLLVALVRVDPPHSFKGLPRNPSNTRPAGPSRTPCSSRTSPSRPRSPS